MLMTFGKYKGQEVSSMDRKYLEWLQDNCNLRGQLAEEVRRLLGTEIDDDQVENHRYAISQIVETLDKRRLGQLYAYAQRLLEGV